MALNINNTFFDGSKFVSSDGKISYDIKIIRDMKPIFGKKSPLIQIVDSQGNELFSMRQTCCYKGCTNVAPNKHSADMNFFFCDTCWANSKKREYFYKEDLVKDCPLKNGCAECIKHAEKNITMRDENIDIHIQVNFKRQRDYEDNTERDKKRIRRF